MMDRFRGLPVFKSAMVPLTRPKRDVSGNPIPGEEEQVAFIKLDDKIWVHPDRWDEFLRMAESK